MPDRTVWLTFVAEQGGRRGGDARRVSGADEGRLLGLRTRATDLTGMTRQARTRGGCDAYKEGRQIWDGGDVTLTTGASGESSRAHVPSSLVGLHLRSPSDGPPLPVFPCSHRLPSPRDITAPPCLAIRLSCRGGDPWLPELGLSDLHSSAGPPRPSSASANSSRTSFTKPCHAVAVLLSRR